MIGRFDCRGKIRYRSILSRLRLGAELAEETHIGNFVEIKKATIGKGSKVNHLTYVGDAETA